MNLAAKKAIKRPKLSNGYSAYDYQRRDAEVVDYKLWRLWTPNTGFAMRGPKPINLSSGEFYTAIGAADTFGRFVERPYPELLGEALGISALNMGFAGVGPIFFNYPRNKILLNLINRSKFVTISIMSGRSQPNSLFQVDSHSQVRYRLKSGEIVPADLAYQQLLDTSDEATIAAIVAETREQYLEQFIQLLDNITVPKILLWFSRRVPDYTESYDSVLSLLGGFPHLINRTMIDKLQPHCDEYVECVSAVGLPQQLLNARTGRPASVVRPRVYVGDRVHMKPSLLSANSYYPSPEMHETATKELIPVCKTVSI